MCKDPLIIDIKGNSLDDGPGIRSVVFFKGCPLRCVWCHNPESKRVSAELWWDREKCIGCGTCEAVCQERAISTTNDDFIDRRKCTLCFACVEECPSSALQRVGREMGVEEIVREIIRYKAFFDNSGGGVTLSGGEPTLFMPFTAALLKRLKSEGAHTLLETCGLFDIDRFKNMILPHTDCIYMDIKLIDAAEHERFCGVSNDKILENFAQLHTLSLGGGFSLLPRTPLIPNITDGEKNLRGIGEFLKRLYITKAKVLPNNPIWLQKCQKLGQGAPFEASDPIRGFYPRDEESRIVEVFAQYGVSASFG